MKLRALLLALAAAVLATPSAAQDRAEACVDTITGNPAMTVAQLRAAENERWPDLGERAQYRLLMIGERLGAWQREQKRIPPSLSDFAGPVAEVPWLSTCDPWLHRVRFTPRGDEWELRSAGPDALFHTPDDVHRRDMFLREARARPAPAPPIPGTPAP
ncbi:MAG TPA: hypothetical protein VEX86_24685 [Longimicrobium sp.]|nr:hypothetical protein [Longimicrobium sp.]